MPSEERAAITIESLLKSGAIVGHKDGNYGSYYPRAEDFGSEGVPFLTAKSLSNGHIDIQGAPRLSHKRANELRFGFVQPGDVLLSHNATVGRVAVVPNVDGRMLIGTSLTYFRVDETKIAPRYLAAYLSSKGFQDQLAAVMSHSTRNQVPVTAQRSLKIVLPSMAEQVAIADILSVFDEKIGIVWRTNETLEKIARAIFRSWFVEFDPVRARAQCLEPEGMEAESAALFPSEFQESSLGMIPMGWSVRKIEDLAERVAMGPFGSSIKVETFVPSGVPVISGNHLRTFMLEDREYNFVSEEHALRLERAAVSRGDIVFTHAGNIGSVSIIPPNSRYTRYILSQRQFFMRCDCSKITPNYVVLYFTSAEGQHRLLANSSSVGVPSIARPVTYLRSIELLVPEKRVLTLFDRTINPVFDAIEHNRIRMQALAELRDTLLPRLISGKLRVTQSEKLVEAVL